jgi:hypothetical protein
VTEGQAPEQISLDRRAFWLGAAIVLIAFCLVLFSGSCRDCQGPEPQPQPVLDIDASAGEAQIAAQLVDAAQQTQVRIDQIRRDNAVQIRNFTDAQREEFEAVATKGPEATAAWFNEFNRRLRNGSP